MRYMDNIVGGGAVLGKMGFWRAFVWLLLSFVAFRERIGMGHYYYYNGCAPHRVYIEHIFVCLNCVCFAWKG